VYTAPLLEIAKSERKPPVVMDLADVTFPLLSKAAKRGIKSVVK
jgi:hypothetical protein